MFFSASRFLYLLGGTLSGVGRLCHSSFPDLIALVSEAPWQENKGLIVRPPRQLERHQILDRRCSDLILVTN